MFLRARFRSPWVPVGFWSQFRYGAMEARSAERIIAWAARPRETEGAVDSRTVNGRETARVEDSSEGRQTFPGPEEPRL
jgi:hypothetical protein